MPRAFVFHGFLSDEECEHLKTLALKGVSQVQRMTDTA